jgi:N utilization substance protein B
MTSRRRARGLALQALYQLDVQGDAFLEQIDDFLRESGVDHGGIEFARSLAVGAWEKRASSDRWIARTAKNWDLERIAICDRNILRIGAYELEERGDTPPAVVINEAVELAKRYSSSEAPQFVNGVLDALRRGLAAGVDNPQ